MRRRFARAVPGLALAWALPATTIAAQAAAPGDWPAYGRDPGGSRYSPLAQLTPANVNRLERAWVHRTGDLLAGRGRFQSTPIMVDGTLYLSSPLGRVSALDPATGRERWTFDPGVRLDGDYGDFANRGVSTWLDPTRAAGASCRRRIYIATIDARLIALDGATGRPCADFGAGGTVYLGRELDLPPAYAGEYQVTSPPAVVGDLVIVGSAIADNQRTDAPSGVVRAYEARTGRLRWRWDPIPRSPADSAWTTWTDGRGAPAGRRTGGANVWSVITADPARDLVFLPTGSASPDFYGGERLGANRYANSLVALRASTGRVVWHRQLVHHDLWDYDLASPPLLFTLRRDGREIPAVAQATKMGMIFMFHRETGEPLHPIEERPVPASDVPGERAWPTQPFPVRPAPLVPHRLDPTQAFGLTEADRAACRGRVAALRNEGIYTPPSLGGTLVNPGNIGGSNWGGLALDGGRGVLVGASNRLPFAVRLVPRAALDTLHEAGREVSPQRGTAYGMVREPLMGRDGVPCGPPPWGALTAVDAATGARLWEVPLGYFPALAAREPAARGWGSVNLGGPIVTAGGLVFIAATADAHLRAFDARTGRELWAAQLPAPAFSTPMTYEVNGRQVVVVAAGGHDRLPFGPLGDWLVAFALPDSSPGSTPRTPTPARVTPPDLAGEWRGDLRLGDTRFPVTVRLTAAGERVRGTVRGTDPALEGELDGRPVEGRLALRITFRYPAKRCAGTIEGEAEHANGGTLLVGLLRVDASCTDGAEPGSFGLRRVGDGRAAGSAGTS